MVCSRFVYLVLVGVLSLYGTGTTQVNDSLGLENSALTAKSQGEYLPAQELVGKALIALTGPEWQATDPIRCRIEYLLVFYTNLANKTGNTAGALACLATLLKQPACQDDPYLAAKFSLAQQNYLRLAFRHTEAQKLNAPLGFLGDWHILGPFDNERGRGFNTPFPPEEKLDLSGVYEGKKRKIAWRHHDVTKRSGGLIDLAAILRPNTQVVAYAATFVKVPKDRDAVLHTGSSGALRVWVNGRVILDRDVRRPFRHDQDETGLRLQAGINLILVKVGAQDQASRFSLRLSAANGGHLTGMSCQAGKPAKLAPPRPGTTKPGPWRAGAPHILAAGFKAGDGIGAYRLAYMLNTLHPFDENDRHDKTWAKKAVSADPQKAKYHYLLARTLSQPGSVAAEKDMNMRRRELEETTRLCPAHAEAFFSLAHYYKEGQDNNTRAIALSRKALTINPHYADARFFYATLLAELGGDAEYQLEISRLMAKPAGRLHPGIALEAASLAAATGNPQKAQKLLTDLLHQRASSRLVARVAQGLVTTGNYEGALALLTEAEAAYPYSHLLPTTQAKLLAARGNLTGAKTKLRRILSFCPEDDDTIINLARLEGEGGNDQAMIALFRQALQFNPNRERIRRHLEFLQQTERPFFADLAQKTDDLINPRPLPPADYKRKNDSHDYLLQHKVIKVNKDGTSHIYEHLVARILSEAGVNHFTRFSRAYFGGEQTGRILTAQVTHPDGTVDRARNTPLFPFAGGSGRIYVKMPSIAVGDIVDIAFRIDELTASVFGTYFGHQHIFSSAESAVVHKSCLQVISPAQLHLSINPKNGAPPTTEKKLPDGQLLRTWTMTRVPRVFQESNMPDEQEHAPLVQISTYRNWDEFCHWWWNLIRRQYDTSPELTAKVEELTRDRKTARGKIHAIYQFVVTDVRYVAWEFGIHGYKPYNASTIFSRRHGDCKDKSILIGAMLKLVGIEAYPVLINGADRRSREDLTLPLVDHFNHCIAYIPAVGDWPGGFLDGTAQYHPATTVPGMDKGARVVVALGPRAKLMQVPWSDPKANLDREEYVVRLTPNGDAHISFTGTPTQNQEIYVRSAYGNEPGKRRENLENEFSPILGKVTVTKMDFSDLLDLDQPVKYQVEMRVKEFAEKRKGALALKAVFEPAEWNLLTPMAKRRFDILLIDPWTDDYTIRYILPPGWEPIAMPPDRAGENEFAAYSVTWKRQGQTVTVRTRHVLKKSRIPISGYDEFRTLASELDNAETTILLVKPTDKGGV